MRSVADPRPTMSMLSCATIESRETVACAVKNFEPHKPFSSPTCHTKSVERFGLTFIVDSSSAISCTATDPEPSSSAPLKIESRRVGLVFRSSASSALICVNCSALPI